MTLPVRVGAMLACLAILGFYYAARHDRLVTSERYDVAAFLLLVVATVVVLVV